MSVLITYHCAFNLIWIVPTECPDLPSSMLADTAPLVIYTNFYINSKRLGNIFTIVNPCDSLLSIIKLDLIHVFSIQFTSISKVCLRNLEVNCCIDIEYVVGQLPVSVTSLLITSLNQSIILSHIFVVIDNMVVIELCLSTFRPQII